ncbi:GNAT family N-acetyltransferase [Nocardioides agariphilus]|uniref:GNAT family N-acetyltransferase n=1 Tax=Nocardioides agariphilus TaxID=433664 RepID=A0A930VSF0_9ACTN|nr:GNAT family N-acetyltransferase [Nocardioides agariphilus]MBF4770000.1 GNAT family N-acetyltransferase [Nocardioides agariphilus]
MSVPPDVVAAESRAWVWVPPNATRVETDEYLLVRMPEWFAIPLELLRFDPERPAEVVVDEMLTRARAFDQPFVNCWVKLHNDPGLDEVFSARGGELDETLDVLALDLADGLPDLGPIGHLELRWALDVATMRDNLQVSADVFGDSMPPADEIAEETQRALKDFEVGSGSVVAYLDGVPVGSGGISLVNGVARLWGGAVREEARGQGAYRAILDARLRRAASRGAHMALVTGRVQTSGPILRRAGFERYGEERSYRVPLG